MAYNHVFVLFAGLFLIVMPLALLLDSEAKETR